MLVIEVIEIKGNCPVHKLGDKIIIDSPKIDLKNTDSICIHALPVLLHYAVALDHGVDPLELGLTKPGDRDNAYVQCVDPWKPYTEGGTVIFRIKKIK